MRELTRALLVLPSLLYRQPAIGCFCSSHATSYHYTDTRFHPMRIQKQRSIRGCWILLLAIQWVSQQHSSVLLSVGAATSPGKPGTTSKARLTTATQNLNRSAHTSSSKASRVGHGSKKSESVPSRDRKSLKSSSSSSSSREPSVSPKKSRRGRASVEQEDVEQYPDTSSNSYDFDEDREQLDEPGFDNDDDDEDEEEEEDEFVNELEMDEEEEDLNPPRDAPRRKHTARRDTGSRDNIPNQRRRDRSTHSSSTKSSSSRSSTSKRVVPYARPNQPNPAALAFTRGIAAIRESIPDASALRETALSTIHAAKATTGVLTANIYREVKGLTSSELEQVMLKATRPDDSPVKGKHVERLVGVTYQISARYDIYDAVLRKLWSKMCEKDWRTTIKALYILHRFSADGAPDHQPALKARLRELRRTKDPKRKEKYFNSKQLLSVDSSPSTVAFRAFLARYAHYVLLRAQCFGGTFTEMSISEEEPSTAATKQDSSSRGKSKRASGPSPSTTSTKKTITLTALRSEHLDAAQMLLKAATVCALKEDEECENTAICVERVVADLIALTAAVAKALNLALESMDSEALDRILLKRWCEFYSKQLLPETKTMMKKMSPILDTYGLFLPSRIGFSVSAESLEKGLSIIEMDEDSSQTKDDDTKDDVHSTKATSKTADISSNTLDNEEEDVDDDKNQDTGREAESVAEDEDETVISKSGREPAPSLSNEGAVDDDEYEYYDEDEIDEEE